MREDGFTVAELAASLLILSLALLPIGNGIDASVRAWSAASDRIAQMQSLRAIAGQLQNVESAHVDDVLQPDAASLETDDGTLIRLVNPKAEKDSTCIFNLVTRKCS